MELKEFIKGVLTDITEAVEESNTDSKFRYSIPSSTDKGIDFDLAIVLKKSGEGKVGAEIFSTIGVKAEGTISKETVNRIQFKVLAHRK